MFVLFTVLSALMFVLFTVLTVLRGEGGEEERRRRGGGGGAPPRGLVAKTWSDQNINFAVSGGAVINRR